MRASLFCLPLMAIVAATAQAEPLDHPREISMVGTIGAARAAAQGVFERENRREIEERRDSGRDSTFRSALDSADKAIQRMFSGEAQDIETPQERTGLRPAADPRQRRLLGSAPEEEEEAPILAHDPENLGERGRRRRTQNTADGSPIFQRGLLGV